MQGWRKSTRTVLTLCLLLGWPTAVLAAQCDEADPSGPAQSAQITLTPNDFVDERHEEMRSFIATDSLGRVDYSIVASRPDGIVRGLSAVPEVSRYSPLDGEQLKGIAVTVSLASTMQPASVVVSLRQVCAKYFRDSFLYY
jgi:hypothetical protein